MTERQNISADVWGTASQCFERVKECARAHVNGGGAGVMWSHLRATEIIARAIIDSRGGRMIGPCAKTTVTCTLVTPDGEHIVGTNYCRNAQPVCPREPGEGYEKCRTVCDQAGHAEIVAVMLAGEKAKGARAYLQGHTYACQPCQEALFGAGVISLSVGIEPGSEA